ncbi:hypothetical protein BS78_09G125300 [Paspalum vaginatum]|nr:hypothetical protein BS78_09G125300 [Paspalum vaginatum]
MGIPIRELDTERILPWLLITHLSAYPIYLSTRTRSSPPRAIPRGDLTRVTAHRRGRPGKPPIWSEICSYCLHAARSVWNLLLVARYGLICCDFRILATFVSVRAGAGTTDGRCQEHIDKNGTSQYF